MYFISCVEIRASSLVEKQDHCVTDRLLEQLDVTPDQQFVVGQAQTTRYNNISAAALPVFIANPGIGIDPRIREEKLRCFALKSSNPSQFPEMLPNILFASSSTIINYNYLLK
ncbi:hypothetical protein MJO28_013753 [Puccinia striiformis f. sp. tritici]|uniref:Uncharacterized protein n=1 Tax=Puccinia striiformis f. sp. tritici TaxID=168172 RepID=A0ACC0DVG4_9BASI|nr:hypothetical protein MJO28_013753 [Puccinia striiformis f. sp. tritici]